MVKEGTIRITKFKIGETESLKGKCPCCGNKVIVECRQRKWQDTEFIVKITHVKWQASLT